MGCNCGLGDESRILLVVFEDVFVDSYRKQMKRNHILFLL
jgi:hypothetical protein